MVTCAIWRKSMPCMMHNAREVSRAQQAVLRLRQLFQLQVAIPVHSTCNCFSGGREKKKRKNHYDLSSQLRADQMPGPPQEGQLMCTLFLSTRKPSNTNDVILPHGENHCITLRCLKQVSRPMMQILQCRALKHNVLVPEALARLWQGRLHCLLVAEFFREVVP